jgi:hypothetical protein
VVFLFIINFNNSKSVGDESLWFSGGCSYQVSKLLPWRWWWTRANKEGIITNYATYWLRWYFPCSYWKTKLYLEIWFWNSTQEYKEGKMLTGEVKQRLIAVLSEIVARHQRARAQVTEEVCNLLRSIMLCSEEQWGVTIGFWHLDKYSPLCPHTSATILVISTYAPELI